MRFSLLSFALLLSACDSDKGITVFNPAPDAQIASHSDGDEVLEGVVITFSGNVTDANHSAEELTATWKRGSEILCEAAVVNYNGTTLCEAVLTPEDTEITLEVKDTDNSPGSDTISIVVVPSADPIAQIITPQSTGVYYSDQKITFEGLITDEEDEAELLVAVWESDLDGDLLDIDTTAESDGSILGYGYLSEGEHAIELNVEDSTGKTDRASVIIDVGPPNSPPLCAITAPLDGASGPEGNSVPFTATASDIDVSSDMLTVIWSSDKDGELGISTPTSAGVISFSYADLSVNQHNITMTVTDEVGATCTTAINYTVGTPPSIIIDAPVDGGTYAQGAVIAFSATVTDAQDLPSDISLDWSVNGSSISTQGATSSGVAEFSDATLVYGAYNLIVTATDTDGLTDSDQINFTINGIPSQPVISIAPDPADTSDALTVNIDTPSIDPEGGTVNYTYEWLMGGAVQSSYISSTVPSSATNKNEQWTVRVTPNDGIADGSVGEASITIVNTAPTLGSLVITPTSNVYNDSVLTCSAVVTDPDETLIPTYEWSLGTTVVGSGSVLNLSSTGAMPNDVVTCAVSVIDDDGASAADSTTAIVENRFPVVSGVSLAPNLVYTNDIVTATAAFTDDDAQTITETYEWHVIDVVSGLDSLVQSSSDNTLSGLTHFERDDVVYVVVTPNDGISDGASITSSSMTISNTAPTSPTVSVSPNPAIYGQDDLICSVVTPSSDADGDSIVYTYEWTDQTGSVLHTTTEVSDTADTLDVSLTSIGLLTCSVTPYDGTIAGASVSATVDVESSCPGSVAMISTQAQANSYVPCTELEQIIVYGVSGVFSIDLPNLVTVHEEIIFNEGEDLQEILLPNLETVGSYVYINGNDVLESIDMDALQTVAKYLFITNNSLLESLVLDSDLTLIEEYSYFANNPLLCVPELDWSLISQDYHYDVGNLDCADTDGDGVQAWEDCDDDDASVSNVGSGGSALCAGESCKTILDDGYSTGDGSYWIDPAGTGGVEVYCDMTTDGGGWSILVDNLGFPSTNIYSESDYRNFCDDRGMIYAGREVDNVASWLVQKRMLWNSNHPIRQNGWPSAWVVSNQYGGSLAMPMYRTSAGLVSIYDGTEVSLPSNLIGDQCDPSGGENFCGYWHSNGWDDSDLSVYPDPEDWGAQHNHADMYISCMFR